MMQALYAIKVLHKVPYLGDTIKWTFNIKYYVL